MADLETTLGDPFGGVVADNAEPLLLALVGDGVSIPLPHRIVEPHTVAWAAQTVAGHSGNLSVSPSMKSRISQANS